MRSTFRSISWLLLTLFATLAFVGQGLHALPGCGHAVATPSVESHAGHCHHSSCGHTAARKVTPRAPLAEGWRSGDFSSADHDCPLCSFFALGQHVTPTVAMTRDLVCADRQATLSCLVVSRPSAHYAPRGPPVL